MSTHLVELMDDAELYGWEAVCAFHAVWLQQMDITLVVSHVPGESLTLLADVLSWYHTGTCFQDIVHRMIDTEVTIISPALYPFHLSDEL